ncbi:MAG: riboflavin synthase [Pseudomonadota bacterium]|nr:riboflavin synthase [Pseudomonadota bacterium]
MFTGIIEAVGSVESLARRGADMRLFIDCGDLDVRPGGIGASIAVSGVCLTAVEFTQSGFAADVSTETLRCSTLGTFEAGTPVNIERALTLQRQLGGHLVSGHVDGLGRVVQRSTEGRSECFTFDLPLALARYVAVKGSIAIDGVSLTVNRVEGVSFSVNLVPHTLMATALDALRCGDSVNVEVDVVARYVERLLKTTADGEGVDVALLREHGFTAP